MEMARPTEEGVSLGMSTDILVAAHLTAPPTRDGRGREVSKLSRRFDGVAPFAGEPTPRAHLLGGAVAVGAFLFTGGRHAPPGVARRATATAPRT